MYKYLKSLDKEIKSLLFPLYIIFFVIFVCVEILPVFFSGHSSPSMKIIQLDKDWHYYWVEDPDPKINPSLLDENVWSEAENFPRQPPGRNNENNLWMRIKIPENNLEIPVLYLYDVVFSLEVYTESRKIYSYGDFDEESNRRYRDSKSHLIPFDRNLSGKYFYFLIYSNLSYIGILNHVFIADYSDCLLKIFIDDLDNIIFGFMFILMGTISIIFYLTFSKFKAFFHFGYSCLFMGIYTVRFLYITTFIVKSTYFWMVGYGVSIFLIPIGFLGMFMVIFPDERKSEIRYFFIFHIIYGSIAITIMLLDMILYIADIEYDFISLSIILRIILCIFILIELLLILRKLLKKSNKENQKAQIYFIGFIIFTSFVIYEIIIDFNRYHFQFKSLLHWGMLGFNFAIVLLIFYDLFKFQAKLIKVKEKLKMANKLEKAIRDESIIILDKNFDIMTINYTTEVLLDKERTDIIEMGINNIILESKSLRHEIDKMLESNYSSISSRFHFKGPKNRKILMDAKISEIVDSKGNLSEIIILSQEVKEFNQLKTDHKITQREAEVITHIINGLRNHEIAREMYITERTVKAHITHIFNKLNVNNKIQLINFLRKYDLLTTQSADHTVLLLK